MAAQPPSIKSPKFGENSKGISVGGSGDIGGGSGNIGGGSGVVGGGNGVVGGTGVVGGGVGPAAVVVNCVINPVELAFPVIAVSALLPTKSI